MHLLPFQKEAVREAFHKKKMLINLPAGSGKSLIALKTAKVAKCKHVLWVCPAFLRLNVKFEIKKWLPKAAVDVILGVQEAKDITHERLQFCVVGYSSFEGTTFKNGKGKKTEEFNYNVQKNIDLVNILKEQNWDLIICDESQHLRKWESDRCKNVVKGLCSKRERLLFMTATPYVTAASDLHPTYSIMQPGKWGTRKAFNERYCEKIRDLYSLSGYRYIGLNHEHAKELKNKAREFVFFRREKTILSMLPPLRVIDVPVEIGKSKLKHADIEEYLDYICDQDTKYGDVDEEIKTERERIGKDKIKHVLSLLETIPKKEQVVIFAWHRSVVSEIAVKLCGEGHSVGTILGGLTDEVRMKQVESFVSGKTNRLVVSISAGGMGLNLQCASIAMFAELPFSYAEFEQSFKRVHRIGSKKKVRIYKLVAVDSMDEDINKMIEKKRLAAEACGVLT